MKLQSQSQLLSQPKLIAQPVFNSFQSFPVQRCSGAAPKSHSFRRWHLQAEPNALSALSAGWFSKGNVEESHDFATQKLRVFGVCFLEFVHKQIWETAEDVQKQRRLCGFVAFENTLFCSLRTSCSSSLTTAMKQNRSIRPTRNTKNIKFLNITYFTNRTIRDVGMYMYIYLYMYTYICASICICVISLCSCSRCNHGMHIFQHLWIWFLPKSICVATAQVASITGPRGPQPGLLAMMLVLLQPIAELIWGHQLTEDPWDLCVFTD